MLRLRSSRPDQQAPRVLLVDDALVFRAVTRELLERRGTSAEFEQSFYALAEGSGARGFIPKAQLGTVEFTRFWPGTGASKTSPRTTSA